MAKKKPAPKKKVTIKKKSASRKKPAPKVKKPLKKAATKTAKPAPKKKPASKKKSPVPTRSNARPREINAGPVAIRGRRGLGSESGGQSGDTQGLSRQEVAESESVEELTEEGQDLEAEIVSGVENAPDPDESEVTTSEVPEDDVPEEYLDNDR